ncbi:MAG: tyrosine-type recombinase/integrase [Xenococcus sp. (in: cyanobacteria)]
MVVSTQEFKPDLKSINKQFDRVSILVSNNRLQLRFNYNKKRNYVSLGLKLSKRNLNLAIAKAALLDNDIVNRTVDETKEKYQYKTPLEVVDPKPKLSFVDVWERYEEYKSYSVTKTTLTTTYRAYGNHVRKSGVKSPLDAIAFQNYLVANTSVITTKRVLIQVNACIRWAVSQGLVEVNNFDGLARQIKAPVQDHERNIDPYTKEELDRIFEVLKISRYYSYYYPYFRFCSLTGVRPSEAKGLKLKYLDLPETFLIKEVFTNGSWKECPKNGKSRRFPINDQLLEVFDLVDLDRDPDELVFPSRITDKPLWDHVLIKVWRKVQEQAGVKYRYPYQLRHTFATMQIEANVPPNHVAKLIGDRLETVLRYYVGHTSTIQVAQI